MGVDNKRSAMGVDNNGDKQEVPPSVDRFVFEKKKLRDYPEREQKRDRKQGVKILGINYERK